MHFTPTEITAIAKGLMSHLTVYLHKQTRRLTLLPEGGLKDQLAAQRAEVEKDAAEVAQNAHHYLKIDQPEAKFFQMLFHDFIEFFVPDEGHQAILWEALQAYSDDGHYGHFLNALEETDSKKEWDAYELSNYLEHVQACLRPYDTTYIQWQ